MARGRRVLVPACVGPDEIDCEIECTVGLAWPGSRYEPPEPPEVEFIEAWVGRDRRPALLDLITDTERERIEVKALDLACDADLAALEDYADAARDDRRAGSHR